jgi:hypothetical protein
MPVASRSMSYMSISLKVSRGVTYPDGRRRGGTAKLTASGIRNASDGDMCVPADGESRAQELWHVLAHPCVLIITLCPAMVLQARAPSQGGAALK